MRGADQAAPRVRLNLVGDGVQFTFLLFYQFPMLRLLLGQSLTFVTRPSVYPAQRSAVAGGGT